MWQRPAPLEGCDVIVNVITPMPEAFFHATGIHGVKTSGANVQGLALRPKHLPQGDGLFLADTARNPSRPHSSGDLPVGQVSACNRQDA